MSLADVQAEVREQHAYNDVLFQADRACRLTHTLHELTMLRNRPVAGMDDGVLAQRRAILDVTIKITKAELKRVAAELMKSLIKWEATDG